MRIFGATSLNAQSQLAKTSKSIATALERLSTGKRVNSPTDDSAAFSLGVRLDSQIRGLTQGVRNLNQTQSLLQTASSAISSQMEIVQQMREIAVQASSGTLSASDRSDLDHRLQQLVEEYERLSSQTFFGDLHLLNGSFGSKEIQIGSDRADSIQLQLDDTSIDQIFRKQFGTGAFQTAATYGAGTGAIDPESIDINNDGNLDLATLDLAASTVSILLGKGDGTFQPRTTIAAANLLSIQFGDLNGDNLADLVTVGTTGTTVALGNGDGSFQARKSLGSGNFREVRIGDINGDNKIDIFAMQTSTNAKMAMYLGNGDGTFSASSSLTVSVPSQDVLDFQIADLNNDGKLDIVTAAVGLGYVNILLGNGDGSFQNRITSPTGHTKLYNLQVADLNADGILDLISNTGSAGGVGIVTTLLGNGDGSFKTAVDNTALSTTPPYAYAYNVQVGDINGDGVADLISRGGDNILSIFVGNGNGTFKAAVSHVLGGTVASLNLRDLNKDGVLDIIATRTDSMISISLGQTVEVSSASDLRVTTQDKAQDLIAILDSASERLLQASTNISALHSRLDYSISSNLLLSESLNEAKSVALDADFAEATAELVRGQILQQAQVAVLAQSNSQMQIVLELLKGPDVG